MVEPENERVSITRQCELLGLNRTSLYYQKQTEKAEDALLMKLIDAQ